MEDFWAESLRTAGGRVAEARGRWPGGACHARLNRLADKWAEHAAERALNEVHDLVA